MKFRIVEYYDRYKAQVCNKEIYNGYQWEDEWIDIGSSNGYDSVNSAKNYCRMYKQEKENKIVEEFEL
jgi:hypothetical protein